MIDRSDGSLAAKYEYDAYGNNLLDPNDPNESGPYADDNPFRFSTKYWDDETGLGYWGYRYYSSRLGRWISRDPSGYLDGANIYSFVGQASVNAVDALGLLKVCCRAVAGGSGGWIERKCSKLATHCVLKDSCAQGEDSYDVWTDRSCDRKLDNGKPCACATTEDIQRCIGRHRYSAKPRGPTKPGKGLLGTSGEYGNNCQTSVILTLGHCCLISNWDPDWYAGDPCGKCLRGHWESKYRPIGMGQVIEYMVYVCDVWEVPDWRCSNPPKEPDPRIPPLPPKY